MLTTSQATAANEMAQKVHKCIHDQLVSACTVTQRNHQQQTQLQKPFPYYQGLMLIDEEDQAVKELKAMSIQYIFQKVTNSDQPNSYRSTDLLQPIQQSSNSRMLQCS